MRFLLIVTFLLSLICGAIAQTGSVISDIVIQGNKRVTRDAILALMRTKVGQPYVQATLDKDRQALLDQGFFQAVDITPKLTEGTKYQVTVTVIEFPVIKEIRVVGNKVVSTEDILKVVTNKPGEVYNLNLSKPIAAAIGDLYSKKGFFARVEDYGPLANSPETLSISIVEWTVGDIKVRGATRTRPEVLKRLIKTRTGEPYNIEKWSNDVRRFYNSQWFDEIKNSADDQRELGKVDLGLDVKEARTGQFNVGLQLDPRSSFAGLLSLSENNLYGTGKSVKVNFIQSTQGSGPSVDLDFSNPYYDMKDTVFRASVYSRVVYRFQSQFQSNTLNTTDPYNERRNGASLGWSRPLNDYQTIGVSGRFEGVITNNIGTTSADQYVKQDGNIGLISFSGTQDKRDVAVDPSRGSYVAVQVEPGYSNITSIGGAVGANQDILGSNIFGRMFVDYRTYFTKEKPRGLDLEAPRNVVALRLRGGTITGKVPFFEQFFAGGADSVRGYQQDRFWGKNVLIGNLEFRHPIQKGFSIIAFVDYGGAWGGYGAVNTLTQSDGFNMNLGYGAGLSFKTPLGPIRLDLGFNSHGQSQTHFLIVTTF